MSAVAALHARGRKRLEELGLCDAQDFAAPVGYSEFLHRVLNRLGPEAAAAMLAEARRPLTPGRLRGLLKGGGDIGYASERGLALIALRETSGLMSTRAALLAASALAEAAIATAIAGEPDLPAGFVVFALGKLGGRELNFYSDLDLVFASPPLEQERDEQRLSRAVRRVTAGLESGWHVDLRLRPFGRAGSLVMSFPAMEAYFQNHGREWERYAWIKARPVAGNRASGRAFLSALQPFVYRRYLDYHVVEALREMKRQIVEAGGTRPRDVKNGPGGIREIEFIVQAFQLVRGGREGLLATPRLRGALAATGRLRLLDAGDVLGLSAAYAFLRRVENRIQIEHRTAEHRLPESEERRLRMAASLGFADWPGFMQELDRHRAAVRKVFDAIFSLPEAIPRRGPAERLWRGSIETEQAVELAKSLGFRAPQESAEALARFKAARAVRLMSARARLALDRVAPELIADAAERDDPDGALARLLALLAALTRRSAYLALLAERPQARSRLTTLVGASEWIAQRLAANPVALDELLDPRSAAPADRSQLMREFAGVVHVADEPELASQRFREINAVQRLKVAAALADGSLSFRAAERSLSLVAEGAVRTALALARARMESRHGHLKHEMLAVAYGKLGSREFGLGSDLDLVFVYDAAAEESTTGLAGEVYLARLAQRAISLLSEPTQLGTLYEVDTRLRPEGAAGLLISRFDAWRRYQHEKAWLWERQALLRARPVAGSGRLARKFRKEQRALLANPAQPARLGREMVDMRSRVAKARRGRSAREAALFDAEFLAAWWLLEAATDCPAALLRCGFETQLAALGRCGTRHPVEELSRVLGMFRREGHRALLGFHADRQRLDEACLWVREQWAEASRPYASPL
ncbi:MAG: bifunctional [glutamate--ammonia ligase]-adenylyl-L-tyrosine phosphorylase/[glutamate--ammonia-ligase] adenylyltransferase [Gammaproteobacteria bacterium]|nr:bifunctional [glutamate--ammonia ligase]-adenylyl-L-tyrosine phosphorylase/[glutamate--ammonia-ligase] adenylyltransferase [Gammaproteobacteria bacterium]